jgi:hypothetical protein
MTKRNVLVVITISALASVSAAFGADTSALSVTVAPEASFASVSAAALTKADTAFGDYSGTTSFTYKIRTSQTTGTGSITVAVVAFTGTGAPAVADLAYTCTAASGTPCASSTAASTTATSVATFGADAHSADAGDAGTAAWTLVDRPQVKTGSYSSTATFTISAT